MSRYQIELPLPPKGCSPNVRGYWARHSGSKKEYRRYCWIKYVQAIREGALPETFKTPVTVHLVFYLANPKIGNTTAAELNQWYLPRDVDNARISFKPGQDALADASLVPGDGQKHVLMGATTLLTIQRQHKGKSCVLVTFVEPDSEITCGS